ncbi:hypothetical protein BDM02DRAFT_3130252 [Thelephora ganbajun]|uniref:Uncharacterized protein n=1 Tax=Thelephora ganbajun TaxID=370292 RepID=A0ACB6ZAY6_THEGA|nr:hypothetical protein BDM02DRAFT_3130252 [Thelephora ganbajun]
MLEGFQPPSPPANPTPSTRVTKGKVKARQASTQVRSQSATVGTVKFGRIVIFPCGDQFRFPTINATSLGPYVNAGLAVEANDTSGITFQLSWGTKQFNTFLHCLFPVLFTYFDMVSPGFKYIPDEPDNIGMKRIKYSLPYVLLEKDYRKYNIVDDTHPTATKYKEALSGDGTNAGFRAKGIFIAYSIYQGNKGEVKFGQIVIFPCGDQFRFPTINATSLGPYINAGLAVEANDTSGITFQLSWGTKQFNAFLHHLFPVLFTYFDTVSPGFKYIPDEPDNISMKRIKYSLPYVLLEKDYRKYNIIDDTHPIATKYKEALSGGGTNAGFRAKGIFIISSDSSEVSQGGSNYVPADIASAGNEETDTDNVKIIEKPPKKRIHILSLKTQDPSTFIQGSSKDGELNSLAQQLQQSASFDESYSKKVWPSDEGADLWNF